MPGDVVTEMVTVCPVTIGFGDTSMDWIEGAAKTVLPTQRPRPNAAVRRRLQNLRYKFFIQIFLVS
jgi:hypothetical protein